MFLKSLVWGEFQENTLATTIIVSGGARPLKRPYRFSPTVHRVLFPSGLTSRTYEWISVIQVPPLSNSATLSCNYSFLTDQPRTHDFAGNKNLSPEEPTCCRLTNLSPNKRVIVMYTAYAATVGTRRENDARLRDPYAAVRPRGAGSVRTVPRGDRGTRARKNKEKARGRVVSAGGLEMVVVARAGRLWRVRCCNAFAHARLVTVVGGRREGVARKMEKN